jgi:hypothetical protein
MLAMRFHDATFEVTWGVTMVGKPCMMGGVPTVGPNVKTA